MIRQNLVLALQNLVLVLQSLALLRQTLLQERYLNYHIVHEAYKVIIHLKVDTLPTPFPVPTFLVGTEKNFQQKILTDGDRKYVVQTLATVYMTYTQKASLKECAIVAKALINK